MAENWQFPGGIFQAAQLKLGGGFGDGSRGYILALISDPLAGVGETPELFRPLREGGLAILRR